MLDTQLLLIIGWTNMRKKHTRMECTWPTWLVFVFTGMVAWPFLMLWPPHASTCLQVLYRIHLEGTCSHTLGYMKIIILSFALSFFCHLLLSFFLSCHLSLTFFCHFFVIFLLFFVLVLSLVPVIFLSFFVIFLSFSYHFLQFLMIFFNCSNFF